MNEMNFSKQLVELRRQKKITQAQLADFLGITKASVSKWELGYTMPDIMLLPRLASYFNISIDQLINYQPQLDEKQIGIIYEQLALNFIECGFNETMNESEALVKEYYSCHKFLLYIGLLWISHISLAPDENIFISTLEKIISLCNHILEDSRDIGICNVTMTIKQIASLYIGDAASVITDLETVLEQKVALVSGNLLTLAYMQVDNIDKASETAQMEVYQNLVDLLNNGLTLLMLHDGDVDKIMETIKRLDTVIDCFELENLNPKLTSTYYYQVSVCLCSLLKENQKYNNKQAHFEWEIIEQKAYNYIKKYIKVEQLSIENGLILKDDKYFDKLSRRNKKSEINLTNVKSDKLLLNDVSEILNLPLFKETLDMDIIIQYKNSIMGIYEEDDDK